MDAISTHWDHPLLFFGGEALYHELALLRRALFEAEDALTPLVLQATRQASAQMRHESQPMDIANLGECVASALRQNTTDPLNTARAIGPHAVAYADEKLGGLRELVDSTTPEECNDL